jgi:iron complex transport system substrate-binding protein
MKQFFQKSAGRYTLTFALIFFTALSLVGCKKPAIVSVLTEAGVTEAPSLRVISGAPSVTEIIVGLGAADCLVAIDRWSANVDGVPAGLPRIDFFYPDIEALIALHPDVIIISGGADLAQRLASQPVFRDGGCTVVDVPLADSIDAIYGDIRRIADLLGVSDTGAGERLIAEMQAGLARHDRAAYPPVSVYFEISPPPSVVTFGADTFLDDLVTLAGGRNIFADRTGIVFPSDEAIIRRNPAVILTNAFPLGTDLPAAFRARPGFSAIDAVREHRIYAISADASSRPSQHVVTALAQITAALWESGDGE